MPLKVIRTPRAREDALSIWTYIARDNLRAADSVVDRFEEIFQLLSRYPELGVSRAELGPDLRSFPDGRFVIFYRLGANAIDIVRILRAARDLNPSMFEP